MTDMFKFENNFYVPHVIVSLVSEAPVVDFPPHLTAISALLLVDGEASQGAELPPVSSLKSEEICETEVVLLLSSTRGHTALTILTELLTL